MKFTIKQYIFTLLFVSLTGLYLAFSYYYHSQRAITAQVIISSIQNELSELSYILSKHLRKESITTARSLLDRNVANNPYISGIAIFDDDTLLLTTDHNNATIISPSYLYNINHDEDDVYTALNNKTALEGTIQYYQGNQLKHYTLLFYIDHFYISNVFMQMLNQSLLLFFLVPIMAAIFMWYSLNILVNKPLELMRQYAYYQSDIPNPFKIKELEYIRASMVQTFSRLEQEKQDLYNLSITDLLSGVANRHYLEERVRYIISESQRSKQEFALLFLDLDHFKAVNDSLGHDVGDELLKNIAGSIQEVLRPNDVVARIGGDEFVIVLTHYKDETELIEIIERIQNTLATPWCIKTYPIEITSSVGIALYPKDGNNMISLMKYADMAMYKAKEKGRKGYHFFTETLNVQTQEYIELTKALPLALKQGEYQLYYQPQNDVTTGAIIGAEALIRWHHPTKGLIAPYKFIPIAENNGFIVELGKWILETAIKQKQAWEAQGIYIKLAINVAVKQIQDPNFVTHLQSLLAKYQVDPTNIVLEITEYVFLSDNDLALTTFQKIKALGVKISLDDFGTGYSSLSYLKTFPIDILKIDKIFLDDYRSESGVVFIETIIAMAHTLKLLVVAEGVEIQEQVNCLQTLNCDMYQGYLCSKPVIIKEFNLLLGVKDSVGVNVGCWVPS